MRLIAAALMVAFGGVPALAQELPRFDVDGHCNEVASFGGSYSAQIDKTCFDMEQESYNALKSMWGRVPGNMKKHCADVAAFGGKGSYQILKACIEMETGAAGDNAGRSFDY